MDPAVLETLISVGGVSLVGVVGFRVIGRVTTQLGSRLDSIERRIAGIEGYILRPNKPPPEEPKPKPKTKDYIPSDLAKP